MVSTGFILGLALLLATPGPTNTLLALGGATGDLRAAPALLAAELVAYLCAVLALGGLIALLGAEMAALRPWMQAAAAAYLLVAAVRMWRFRAGLPGARPVGPGFVATTTLLNPKTLIIAFVLMPEGWSSDGTVARAHLLAMAAMIPLAGLGWFLGGRAVAAMAGGRVQAAIPRASAMLLGLFAMVLAGKALAG